MLALKNINYKASIIGVLIMQALKNIKYSASNISILIALTLKNIQYKASIIGILIMLALKYKVAIVFLPTYQIGKVSEINLLSFCQQNL